MGSEVIFQLNQLSESIRRVQNELSALSARATTLAQHLAVAPQPAMAQVAQPMASPEARLSHSSVNVGQLSVNRALLDAQSVDARGARSVLDNTNVRVDPNARPEIGGGLTAGGLGASGHANAGPNTHSNGVGHADFTRQAALTNRIRDQLNTGVGASGHANAGPNTHSNGVGHADFTRQANLQNMVSNPATARASSGHANAGPNTHSNGVGHADFTRQANLQNMVSNPATARASSGHANAGPNTHSNGVGHADFTRQMNEFQARISLPDGRNITLGDNAPAQISIGNFVIRRMG